MGTRRGEFSIVRVVSHCRLIDDDGEHHIYWRRNGLGVANGWYVVTWPAGGVRDRFDETTMFVGPYATRDQARAAVSLNGVEDLQTRTQGTAGSDRFRLPPDQRLDST